MSRPDVTVEVPEEAIASLGLVRLVNVPNPAFMDFSLGGGPGGCTPNKVIDFSAPGVVLGLATVPNGSPDVDLRVAGTTNELYAKAQGNLSALAMWDPSADILEYACDMGTPNHVGLRITNQ